MVNSFHEYKVESLKAERYTLQSSIPVHPSKNMPYLFLYIHACKKSLLFVTSDARSYGMYIPVYGMTLKSTQQTFIIRNTIKDAITKCLS